jgi:phosphotransferase system  glucose/maltose/N-acetylglucosamine-specific IIC component
MGLMPVVPVVVVVTFWAIVFVVCFAFLMRQLRLPTDPELEAAHESASSEESSQIHTH